MEVTRNEISIRDAVKDYRSVDSDVKAVKQNSYTIKRVRINV